MRFMLDTNTCIFVINNVAAVRARFVKEYPSGLAISALTEAELWFGVENNAKPEKMWKLSVLFSQQSKLCRLKRWLLRNMDVCASS